MNFLTTITTGVDLGDCIGICGDDDSILHILRSKYEKRCFMGMFILSVDNIKTQGDCIVNQYGSASFGTLSVICNVTAVMLLPDSVITGCVVKNKDKSGVMICEAVNTKVMIKNHPLFESINIGQIIAARVGKAKYNPGSNVISVNAFPFLPAHTRPVYKLGAVTADDMVLLADTIAAVLAEEELAANEKKNSAKSWEFFSQLLYAYNEKQKIPPAAEEMKITDLLKESGETRYITRDPKIELSRPIVYRLVDYNDTTLVTMPPAAIIMEICNDYIGHLRLIREMVAIYADEKTLLGHKNLWQIYKKNKK